MRDQLKAKREKLGLTQENIASMVGIARNTYTNIELGYKNPSLKVALNIKKVLGETNDDIFLINNVPKQDKNNFKAKAV